MVAHQVHVETLLAVLGRAELHTELGDLLLKKLRQGARAIELMVDILPHRDTSHRTFLRGRGRLSSKPHARPGVQGGCAKQRQNHESTVTVPLRPGARDRPAGGIRCCVLLLIALRGGAQTTRTGSGCFLWTGQPDPRDRTV